MFSIHIVYVMALVFLVLLVFGERKYKACALIIFTSCILNILTNNPINTFVSAVEERRLFLEDTNISILWDSATVLFLITSMFFNQASGKQALILCFAIFFHMSIVYDMTIEQTLFTGIIYNWYIELIVLVGILQMMVAKDGIRTAFIGIWNFIFRNINNNCSVSESLLEREEE